MTGSFASRRLPALAALLLVAPGPAWTELEFTLSVDRDRVSPSQPVQLTLRLAAESPLGQLGSPAIDLREFIVHGPAVIDMESRDHRGARYTRELRYTLYARNPGRFAVGPARLEAEGKVLTTEAVEVQVRGGKTAGPKRGDAGERQLEDDLFVRVDADRDTAWVGEQVIVRFDLCYRYHLRNPRLAEVPEYTGFWVEELFAATRLDPNREMIDGLPFQVAPLRHVALFPTASGSRVIDPLGITCSLLNDPIFGRSRSLMVRSDAVPIHVRPLPERGRPAGFAGAVGEFALSAEAGPADVRVGDPVTLRVEIAGTGNIRNIPEPALEPAAFEVYEPKVEVEEARSAGGRYKAVKRLEYILIPDRAGRLEIPALRVAYFDPGARRYRTASSPPIEIRSRGDGGGEGGEAYDLTRREIERLGRDIRHIKPDMARIGSAPPLYRNGWYWLAHALLPGGYIALVAWNRHRRRLERDVAYARRRRSGGELAGRLREAGGRTEEGEGFHAALQEALVAFIADQANLPAPGLTRERCRQELEDRGVEPALAGRVDAVLERCEFGRYAPAETERGAREELLAEAGEVAALLRKALS